MSSFRRSVWLLVLLAGGCASGPPLDNPVRFRPDFGAIENPVMIAPGEPGPYAYAEVFETVLDVVDDHFEIAYANRYDGRIVSHPQIAPGVIEWWRPGSPDARERILATLQSIRYRADIQIQAALEGGYLVQVRVFKELLDLPRPLRATSPAVFREAPTVERQYTVVEAPTEDRRWIPEGRETHLEQLMLSKLRECQR